MSVSLSICIFDKCFESCLTSQLSVFNWVKNSLGYSFLSPEDLDSDFSDSGAFPEPNLNPVSTDADLVDEPNWNPVGFAGDASLLVDSPNLKPVVFDSPPVAAAPVPNLNPVLKSKLKNFFFFSLSPPLLLKVSFLIKGCSLTIPNIIFKMSVEIRISIFHS